MSRRTALDLLRPGCACPVFAAVPAHSQQLLTRRTYCQQYAGVAEYRNTAPRAMLPAERWWSRHPG